jgi:hypothetical protein
MTREEALAAAIKLLCALPVLRWPLVGTLVSIAADAVDVVIMSYVHLGGGGIRDYHAFDKLTDVPGLIAFFAVTLGWRGRDRAIAVTLFAARVLGVALFELAQWRDALLFFPNVFESWFLYVLLRDRFVPADAGAGPRGALLALLVAGKLGQEYVLHHAQWLDRIALADVVERFGTWIRGGER